MSDLTSGSVLERCRSLPLVCRHSALHALLIVLEEHDECVDAHRGGTKPGEDRGGQRQSAVESCERADGHQAVIETGRMWEGGEAGHRGPQVTPGAVDVTDGPGGQGGVDVADF